MPSLPNGLSYRVLVGSVSAANANHTYHTITGSQGGDSSVWKTTYAGLSFPGFSSGATNSREYDNAACLGLESHAPPASAGSPLRVPIPLFPHLGGAPVMLQNNLTIESYPSGGGSRHRGYINGFAQNVDGTTSWGPVNMYYPRNYFLNNIMCDNNSFLYIETKQAGVYHYYITQVKIWEGS